MCFLIVLYEHVNIYKPHHNHTRRYTYTYTYTTDLHKHIYNYLSYIYIQYISYNAYSLLILNALPLPRTIAPHNLTCAYTSYICLIHTYEHMNIYNNI